jgi:hypothetical protein
MGWYELHILQDMAVEGIFERANECLGFVKCREVFD